MTDSQRGLAPGFGKSLSKSKGNKNFNQVDEKAKGLCPSFISIRLSKKVSQPFNGQLSTLHFETYAIYQESR